MTFRYTALGCKVNQCEIRQIAEELARGGLSPVPFETPADVTVINTCAVTAESGAKSRKLISRARRQRPDGVIAVTGCYAESEKGALKGADLVISNAEKDTCAEKILAFLKARGCAFSAASVLLPQERTRATLKVQDGCDNFCAYCIIPYLRHPLRSKPLKQAAEEAKKLADAGYHEIVLVGIHLTKYGVDLNDGTELADLLEALSRIKGIERLRLGSMEPGYLTRERAARLSRIPQLCPHFHISLQSGCDLTLKRMNRHYTTADYAGWLSVLREYFPGCAVTTDVMTGFSGETQEEFEQSLKFVRSCRFAKVHVFPYSVRPGTAAASLEQIPEAVRKERARRMIEETRADRSAFFAAALGDTRPVLCEREEKGLWQGFTPDYIPVSFSGKAARNQTVSVRITGFDENGCKGEAI